ALAAGDNVDFLVGRGADNNGANSGLKIQATLTLLSLIPTAPAIVTQPVSQALTVGDNATFTVSATGTDPLSYQWYFNETNTLDGATQQSFTRNNVQLSEAGKYSVVVSNAINSVTSQVAVLTVQLPPLSTYDLGRGFSASSNPNGVWSYGWVGTINGPFT